MLFFLARKNAMTNRARSAVLRYKRIRDTERESALKNLAELSQRHRLGY